MLLRERNTPRWIIFMIDIAICLVALATAYLLRFDFLNLPIDKEIPVLIRALPVYILVRGLTFYFGKTYQGIVRHTSTQDAKRIAITVTIGSGIFMLLSPLRANFVDGYNFLPLSIIVIDWMATLVLMIASRIAVKLAYLERMKSSTGETEKVLIYGAGEMGHIAKRTIDRDMGSKYKVVAFVDDDKSKSGKRLEGIRIHGTRELQELIQKHKVDHVIIGILNPGAERKKHVIETCLAENVNVLNVPPVDNWINGELSFRQIRKVRIEDLLGRQVIELDQKSIADQIKNRTVLVTGAAGSIGSEIVRQLLNFAPGRLVLLDQAESALFELEMELTRHGLTGWEAVVADIRNLERMERVYEHYQPEVVYHAAAYKHVPLMEHNPSEALRTNIYGTKVLTDLSVKYGVSTFVMISTDKAVNPTSVMGASKRVAEIYAQVSNQQGKTKFITTRFGNVLGSNGSVIPLFRKQIEEGGPVTVTHEEVTRFFMTIPEACQLVLEAGAMGQGGEIFIFDMGESVKIIDLAHKMIKLSGLEPGKDIEIKITGLRPGEKLYEELLATEENTKPTHHGQIMIAQVKEYEATDILPEIEALIGEFDAQNNEAIVRRMKGIVPEYQSNNSEFSRLD